MKIFRTAQVPWQTADLKTFTPLAHVKRLAEDTAGVPVGVYQVRFEAQGRTHWHTHSGPQWLLVVEGRVRVQAWGKPPVDAEVGDAVAIPPGEKHWHGAMPGASGAHLAVNVHLTTEWLEAVTDEQYGR